MIVKRVFVALGMNIHNCIHLAMDVGAFKSEIINIWAEQLKPAAEPWGTAWLCKRILIIYFRCYYLFLCGKSLFTEYLNQNEQVVDKQTNRAECFRITVLKNLRLDPKKLSFQLLLT